MGICDVKSDDIERNGNCLNETMDTIESLFLSKSWLSQRRAVSPSIPPATMMSAAAQKAAFSYFL